MTTDWLETLHDVGRAVYEAFLLPGDFLLLRFAAQAPALALSLGIDSNSDAVSQSAILSAVSGCFWSASYGSPSESCKTSREAY
jgi:hypothetical protein